MNVRNDPCNVYYGTLRPILTLDNKMYKRKGYVEKKTLKTSAKKIYIFLHLFYDINKLFVVLYLS